MESLLETEENGVRRGAAQLSRSVHERT